MRRLSRIVPVILFLALLAGCTADKSSDSAESPQPSQQISAGSNNEKQNSSANDSDQGAELVVKSSNQSSSQEKAMVLDEISQEMDRMIDGINSVEEVSDEDLNI